MANEAIKRYAQSAAGDVIQDYTVADGTGIEKGTLLQLSDPRTASAQTGGNQLIAGIAAREKVADDGRTQLAVHTKGDFDMIVSGSCTIGQPLCSGGIPNSVSGALGSGSNASSGAQIIGYALEAGSEGEVIHVRLNL